MFRRSGTRARSRPFIMGPQRAHGDSHWLPRLVPCVSNLRRSAVRAIGGDGISGLAPLPSGDRGFADSLLEGGVSCELVSENAKFPASREFTGALRWCRGDSSAAPNQPPRHGGHDGPKHRDRAGRSHRSSSAKSRPLSGLLQGARVCCGAPRRGRRCRDHSQRARSGAQSRVQCQ